MRSRLLSFVLALSAAPLAAQTIHPVLDAKSGYLLGAPVNGVWRDGEHVVRLVRGGRRYRVFGPAGLLGVSTGSRPEGAGDPCPESFAVNLAPARDDAEVAVDGAWNVSPRPVTRLSTAAAAGYAGAVRQILVQHGIRTPQVHVTGALRADLDGDGTDEVVVTAYRTSGNETSTVGAGDYSLAFVRRLVAGSVRTIMLEQEYHPRAHDETTPNEYAIAGAWDLDGDGKLEVVIRASYYEGGWTTLYSVGGSAARTLASVGCGA
jgi:hypothetical protein